jgi:hypothetical protein
MGLDLDPRGAGVDGVVDQFLDGARGPFDHLAGGDAVDGFGRQATDGHHTDFHEAGPSQSTSIATP